jgi:septal ring factor EnvC (AmiA/AmiB activator)
MEKKKHQKEPTLNDVYKAVTDFADFTKKQFENVEKRFDGNDRKFELFNRRFELINLDIKDIKQGQREIEKDLQKIKEDISGIAGAIYEQTEKLEDHNMRLTKLERIKTR